MIKNYCNDCQYFIGGGDWDLCCKNPPKDQVGYYGFLCYEDTPACENFKIKLRAKIKLRKDTTASWQHCEYPLHAGEHSQ